MVLYINFLIIFPSTSINPLSLWLKANNWPVTMIVSLTFLLPLTITLAILIRAEYHPHRTKRSPTRIDNIVRCPQRLPSQTCLCDVNRNLFRLLLLPPLGYMVYSHRAAMVCILFQSRSHCLRATIHGLGQRNLFRRRRGTSFSPRHDELSSIHL